MTGAPQCRDAAPGALQSELVCLYPMVAVNDARSQRPVPDLPRLVQRPVRKTAAVQPPRTLGKPSSDFASRYRMPRAGRVNPANVPKGRVLVDKRVPKTRSLIAMIVIATASCIVACAPVRQSVVPAIDHPGGSDYIGRHVKSTGAGSGCTITSNPGSNPVYLRCYVAPGDTLQVYDLTSSPAGNYPVWTKPEYTCTTLGNTHWAYDLGNSAQTGLSITGNLSSTHLDDCQAYDLSDFTITLAAGSPSFYQTEVHTTGTFTVCNRPPFRSCAGSSESGANITIKFGAMPTPVPTPTPSPTPPCTTAFPTPSPANSTSPYVVQLNNLIAAHSELQSIVSFLSSNGRFPTLQVMIGNNRLPPGVAAQMTNPNTLQWDPVNITAASAAPNNQLDYQILFHELVHAYDAMPNGHQGYMLTMFLDNQHTLGATFNGTAYTWNSDAQGAGDYEHAFVHNAIVNAFGTDHTGALQSALQNVDANWANDVANHRADLFSSPTQAWPQFPPTVYNCNLGPHSKTRSPRDIVVVDPPVAPTWVFQAIYAP